MGENDCIIQFLQRNTRHAYLTPVGLGNKRRVYTPIVISINGIEAVLWHPFIPFIHCGVISKSTPRPLTVSFVFGHRSLDDVPVRDVALVNELGWDAWLALRRKSVVPGTVQLLRQPDDAGVKVTGDSDIVPVDGHIPIYRRKGGV